jgi:hypothetical protein
MDAVAARMKPPLSPLGRKLIAVAAFVVAALLLYFIDNIPAASTLDESKAWTAGRSSELIVFGPPRAQIFEFNGAPGAGLDVRASTVRLSEDSLAALDQAGAPRPTAKGVALSWLGRTDPSGKINLTVENLRASPDAGLSLVATGNANIPQLRLTPIQTALTITVSAPAGDSASVPPIELKIGDKAVPQPIATMMPVRFELPPGESVFLTFPSEAAMRDASFRLGLPASAEELASDLPIDRFEIGPRRTDPTGVRLRKVEQGVCAASAGHFLWTRLTPRLSDCGGDDKDDKLAIEDLQVAPSQLAMKVSGAGFVTKDGKPVVAGLLTKIANNKLVAALLALFYAALARWVWKSLTGSAT